MGRIFDQFFFLTMEQQLIRPNFNLLAFEYFVHLGGPAPTLSQLKTPLMVGAICPTSSLPQCSSALSVHLMARRGSNTYVEVTGSDSSCPSREEPDLPRRKQLKDHVGAAFYCPTNIGIARDTLSVATV